MKTMLRGEGADGSQSAEGTQGKRHRFNDPCGTFNPLLNEQRQTQKLGIALRARMLPGTGQTLAGCNIPNHTLKDVGDEQSYGTVGFERASKYKYPLSLSPTNGH